MSVKMQIDKDGNLVFQDTKIKLNEVVRFNGTNFLDGSDNIVDITTMLGDIFNTDGDSDIVERAILADNALKVGGVLAEDVLTVFNYSDTIPVTPTPIISLDDGVNSGGELTGTVDNFSPDTAYITSVTLGEITIGADGTVTYQSPSVDENTTDTITVIGIDDGSIRSSTFTKVINVYAVTSSDDSTTDDGTTDDSTSTTTDQTLSNPDYAANAEYDDGFEY